MLTESRDESSSSSAGVGRECEIYGSRFSSAEDRTRATTWEVLVQDFLQKFVSPGDTVVDIGAGDGHFIKNIKAARRVAVDLSPHVKELEDCGVEVLQVAASEFTQVFAGEADVVFMSNFLEHLPNKRAVLDVLDECRRALKPGGMLLVLQPNIRYTGPAYWDYIDHHIALTELSLKEALQITGFDIVECIPRFFPYTAKSTLGSLVSGELGRLVIRWYLKWPLFWRVFGKQTFVAAKQGVSSD